MRPEKADSALFGALCGGLLSQGMGVRFTARGGSMQPGIRDGEVLHLVPADPARLRMGDVVLARSGGRLKAHRIVAVNADRDRFRTQGDAELTADRQVAAGDILAKVVAVEKNSRRREFSPARNYFDRLRGRTLAHLRAMHLRALAPLLLFALAICAVPLQAQVAIDSSTSLGQRVTAGTTTLTFAHTTAGANRLMIVGVSINTNNNNGTTVSSVTYNGVALTQIGAHNDANFTRRVEMWQLIAPPTGTFNVVVTVNIPPVIGGTLGVVAGATTFTNVNQTNPVGAFVASDAAATTAPSVAITGVTGEILMDVMAAGGNRTITAFGAGQTAQWNLNSTAATGATDVRGSGSTKSFNGATTMSETLSATSNWSIGAIAVKPANGTDLSITKAASPASVTVGQNSTYTITVTNNGPSAATGVTMTDLMPAGMTFVSATPSQGTCAGTTTVTCTLGGLANAASATITIVATANASGLQTNTASVTGNESDPKSSNNTTTATVVAQSSACGTPGSIGAGGTLTGIVNTYYPATATANAGATSITLGAATGATAIASGDLLLVIQMQDAAINSTNTDSYGNGVAGTPGSGFTALNSAGKYEYVRATNAVALAGGTLNLAGTGAGSGLLNTYTNAAATGAQGKRAFQVVRVPQYTTATLSSGLTASRWNGTTGGILVIDVAGTLTLGGNVDVSGFGFRGGGGRVLAGGAGAASDYVTLASNATNGSKGEGIAGTPRFVYNQGTGALVDNGAANEGYPNGSYARGAPANAGGGGTDGDPAGNDDNSGGGGGANGGDAGGGGNAWNSAAPIGGDPGDNFPATASAIVMGGGGGAGTTNNGTSDPNTNTTGINSSGAAGGGIIIIRAGAITGTGTLTSNGASALNVQNDGGGGGGGGGTVMVLVNSGNLNGLTINAIGGNGGNTWLTQPPAGTPGERHGPGGGGSGGVILVSSLTLTASSVLGGTNGLSTTANDAFGATPGAAGFVATASMSAVPGVSSGTQCSNDLSISKSASPEPVNQNSTLTYTITVTNNGFTAATAVTMNDPLPAGVLFLSLTTSQGSCTTPAVGANGTVNCTLGALASGATATITINVRPTIISTASLTTNTATVSETGLTDIVAGNNTSSASSTVIYPTAVKLQSFTAIRVDGKVLLEWKTGGESHNLGFNIYTERNGERVKLNPSLVSGSALLLRNARSQHAAKTYSWLDTPAAGQSGNYWLEDVDVSGARTLHGPAFPQNGGSGDGGPRGKILVRSQMMSEISRASLALAPRTAGGPIYGQPVIEQRILPPDPVRDRVQAFLAGQPAIKISVSHEGWYRVTQSDLAAAGLDASAPVDQLQLFAEGIEQPLNVVGASGGLLGANGAIEFYGTGIDTPYSGERVYWLIAGNGNGRRVTTARPFRSRPDLTASFPYTVELRDRTTYFAALLNGDADNFFGAVVTSAPVDQLISALHLDPNSTGATLEVTLQGVTDFAPHRVSVRLNNNSLGDVSFMGQAQGTATLNVPAGLLQDGVNTVTLVAAAGDDDISLVDHIRLRYQHTYQADNDSLRFSAAGGITAHVGGFTQPGVRVFDLSNRQTPQELRVNTAAETDGTYTAEFSVPGMFRGVHTLLALADDRISLADDIHMNRPSHWRQEVSGSSMVILTTAELAPHLAPLRDLHAGQGISVAIVDVEDLYDEFNFGEKQPQALRDFLNGATLRWQTKPHYLLLAGDASVDPRNYLGFGDFDLVPTRIIDTAQLETATDAWFTDFSNTGIEQIATGRLPARTTAEMDVMVSKIVNYQSSAASGDWVNQAFLVGDRDQGFSFSSAVQDVQTMLPPGLTVNTVQASVLDPASAHAAVLAGMNSGSLLVNYIGHGSVELWSGEELLSSSEASALNNGSQLPVVFIMDCLNGFFHDVYTQSLAESLMLAPNGGAVAVWASSGLTEPAPQVTLNQGALSILFSDPSLAVGDAVRLSKAGVNNSDVRQTWIFFGDPAMHLKAVPPSAPSRRAQR